MAKLKLWCSVYGESNPFLIEIERNAAVDKLQKTIFKNQRYLERFSFPSSDVTLYVARTNSTWLQTSDRMEVLSAGVVDKRYARMEAYSMLSDYFDETFEATRGEMHVLVELPPSDEERAAKRQRVGMIAPDTSLAGLWKLVNWQSGRLPSPDELKERLLRPLPFRLKLQGQENCNEIFKPDAPLITCSSLTQWMEYYLFMLELAPSSDASSRSWLQYYATLLQIPKQLCNADGVLLEETRLGEDAQELTSPIKRPDCFVMYNGAVLLRGEERDASVPTAETLAQLSSTMGRWNERIQCYLPYSVSYATSGSTLELAVVEPFYTSGRYTSILSLDILAEKELALKVFVNLTVVLWGMAKITQRSYEWTLDPLKRHDNESRTTVLLDHVVVRKITRTQCRDAVHFQRLGDVYTTLQQLNSPTRVQVPYLQAVERLTQESKELVVHLSPVGCPAQPQDCYEAKQWLMHMLTAPKHWHETGYCHGDILWSNIVFVPSGHWVLIDMDKSSKHDTEIITWAHQREGERLRFQHDLFQLGKLMETLWVKLPEPLKEIQALLLEAVDKSEITAADALVLVNKVEVED